MTARRPLVETREPFTVAYVRSSRAVGVLWGVFGICYGIICVVVFVTPQWLGDTVHSPGSGYFGLWRRCAHTASLQGDPALTCSGRLSDLSSNLSAAFRASTVLTGLALVVALLSIICFLMFCFLAAATVHRLCAYMQLFSGVCLMLAVLVFPAGWDAELVREVCGPSAGRYHPGGCGVRWALLLAGIGSLDALALAALGLALGKRRLLPPPQPQLSGSLPVAASRHPADPVAAVAAARRAEAASLASSHRSMRLHPVMLLAQQAESDRLSQHSLRSARSQSRHSELSGLRNGHRGGFHNGFHNGYHNGVFGDQHPPSQAVFSPSRDLHL